MSDITVRAARMADEPAILELAREEMRLQEALDKRFRLRPDAEARYAVYLRDRMRDIDSSVFVAERDGEIVGLAVGSIRNQETFFEMRRFGYISDLVVTTPARRQGVGRALYERIALWFRSLGIRVARLHVAMRSEEARTFWRSLGADEFLAEAWIDLVEDRVEESRSAPQDPGTREGSPARDILPAGGGPETGSVPGAG